MSVPQSDDSGSRPWWQINAETWGTTFLRIRLPIITIAAIGLILFFASRGTLAGFFIGVLWWFGPFLVYLFFITSRTGSVLFGVLLLLVSAFELFLILISMETSSTAAIGFLTLPVFTYPGVVVAVVLDQFLRRTKPS